MCAISKRSCCSSSLMRSTFLSASHTASALATPYTHSTPSSDGDGVVTMRWGRAAHSNTTGATMQHPHLQLRCGSPHSMAVKSPIVWVATKVCNGQLTFMSLEHTHLLHTHGPGERALLQVTNWLQVTYVRNCATATSVLPARCPYGSNMLYCFNLSASSSVMLLLLLLLRTISRLWLPAALPGLLPPPLTLCRRLWRPPKVPARVWGQPYWVWYGCRHCIPFCPQITCLIIIAAVVP